MDKRATPGSQPTPDESMSEKDKEELEDQLEEFEGPMRREVRGDARKEPADDPGVAHS